MVGIQCKSCGHRALATPPGPFKFDHEIHTWLSQRNLACGECGGTKYTVMRLQSSLADDWLEGGASSPNAGSLIEGDG
jgi:hypothetical protein